MRTNRAVLPFALLALTIAPAACGGKSHTKATGVKSTTSSATTARKPAAAKVTHLTELVRGTTPPAFAPSASVAPGDIVVLRTLIPGAADSAPVRVALTIAPAHGRGLVVTARANGETSTATLTSSIGKQVMLVGLRYTCLLPPEPTFCPAHHLTTSRGKDKLSFTTSPRTGVVMLGQVGPVPKKPGPPAPTTGAVVPTYGLRERLQVIPPHDSRSSIAKPSTTVKVSPGDTVVLISVLLGHVVGAPQRVSITFNQGPSKTLRVTGTVAGGQSSTATIGTASGSPIALVSPPYTCFLPPAFTFCPAEQTRVGAGSYTVTFSASPASPIELFAKVQGG